MEILPTFLDLFVAITEGVDMVLENDATAGGELTASLFYLLKVGDDMPPNPFRLPVAGRKGLARAL